MVNILLNTYRFDSLWCFDYMKKYIQPDSIITVFPFSFRDELIYCDETWQSFYNKDNGPLCKGLEAVFSQFGVDSANIQWVNYFKDTKESAILLINNSDILYFCGGLPDRMMVRLAELNIMEVIQNHPRIIMGDSAGAVIQLKQYHLTPDKDYPVFNYYQGLGFISEFDIEMHFENNEEQSNSIKKVRQDTDLPVYAIKNEGAVIVDNGTIYSIGNVICYN